MWQSTLAHPDRESLLYRHGNRVSLVKMTGAHGHHMSRQDPAESHHCTHDHQWWNVQYDNAIPHVAQCWSGVSAAPQHLDITLACPFARWKTQQNIYGMHWIGVCIRGIHHPSHFLTFLQHLQHILYT